MRIDKDRLRTPSEYRELSRDRTTSSNVVGGPLDGATFPSLYMVGATYRWDGHRWIYVSEPRR